jgi:hypothetical protein
MNKILSYLIILIHILLILFIIFAPICNVYSILIIHSLIIPSIIIHWIFNNNICALTSVELYLKNGTIFTNKRDECFTCKIIDPIYTFNTEKQNKFIYLIMILLFLISYYKIYTEKTKLNLSWYNFILLSKS